MTTTDPATATETAGASQPGSGAGGAGTGSRLTGAANRFLRSSGPGPKRIPLRLLVLGALALVLLLSLVRQITGANDLTSPGTMGAALALAVPIGLAALGGLFAERAGVVNIGLEGMMIFGTWFGAWAGYQHGPWVGVVVGVLGGMLGGLIHAVATVTFGVDHIVSGVAINILAAGAVRYLSAVTFAKVEGGGVTQSPALGRISTVSLPVLSGAKLGGWQSPDLLNDLANKEWFFVSDVAGLLRGLTGGVSLFTVLAVLLIPAAFLLLWKTSFGLRLRSVGENPSAAESLGVKVYTMKYIGVLISGGLAGLAGAFLVTVASSNYQEGQTAGRGYIGLAAMIFGNWRPGGLAAGAGLFGFADATQLRSGVKSVHALLLFTAIVLAVVAGRALLRRNRTAALTSGAIAALFLVWYLLTDTVPAQLSGLLPYVTTLLVLSLASQRLRPPAADGQPYRRGQQT